MKTQKTKALEKLLYHHFNDRNDFFVFETTIGWYGKEIVDCIMYNCQREIHCYEIKSSKSDFHSKSAKTFIGHKNYYVMPYSLYEEVKNEIPYEIGVYVAIEKKYQKEAQTVNKYGKNFTEYSLGLEDGLKELYCIKPCKKQELKADKEVILSSMLRSMQRDRVMNFEELSEVIE